MAHPNMECMEVADITDKFTKILYKVEVSEALAAKFNLGKFFFFVAGLQVLLCS